MIGDPQFEDGLLDEPGRDPKLADSDAVTPGGATRRRRRRWPRRIGLAVAAVLISVVLVVAVSWVALSVEGSGTPSAAARGSNHDAEWLGHAWVDGRKTQPDVDALAAALRDTGIRDLFVHAGPFSDEGTLDPALRPRARWVVRAMHAAIPEIRVQAWLGARPIPGELDLASPQTRANMLVAVGQVLNDGFD